MHLYLHPIKGESCSWWASCTTAELLPHCASLQFDTIDLPNTRCRESADHIQWCCELVIPSTPLILYDAAFTGALVMGCARNKGETLLLCSTACLSFTCAACTEILILSCIVYLSVGGSGLHLGSCFGKTREDALRSCTVSFCACDKTIT